MKKKFTFFIALTMFGLVANSQNFTIDETNDTIDVNTTWAYDTVFMDASAYVLDDVTLTINPGAVIMFNDFYKMKIEGTLLSQGTETDTIVYTVADTTGYSADFSHTGWDGIDFDTTGVDMDDNDTTRFSYCAFYFGKEIDDWEGGGAIRIEFFSKIKIENSLFRYNSGSVMGGAISIQNDAEPIILNCTFLYNNAEAGGGAINIGHYNDNLKFDQAIISNCYFSNNKSWWSDVGYPPYCGGGALKISGCSDAYVYNNVFENNTSLSQGGALITSGSCSPYIINNLFVNNEAVHSGGAIGIEFYAGGNFINNTIVGNYSDNDGGAVSIGCDNDSVFFANNIIGINTDDGNDYDQFYIDSEHGDMKFYNNDIQGGLATYTNTVCINNIDEDPLFVDPENGDFSLQSSSPCINTGLDTTIYIPEYDLAGVQRIIDDFVDMGAYEYNPYENISSINENMFSVYPNPAVSYVNIQTDDAANFILEVRSITGQLIYSSRITSNNHRINTSGFAKGVYLVKINSEKTNYIQKLIIQ